MILRTDIPKKRLEAVEYCSVIDFRSYKLTLKLWTDLSTKIYTIESQ